MIVEKTKGIIAAPYSPMKEDGSLNPEAVKGYANLLIRNNVKGAFVCGSSGEGLSLTISERKELAELWVYHGRGNIKIIIHVGATSIKDSQELAEHAATIGASAIAAIEPIYYLGAWQEDLVKYYKELSSASPGLPFYSYYIPGLTHYQTDYVDFCERAIREIPDFVGVKYTNNNLFEFAQLIKQFGKQLDLLFGTDELLINALASGAVGAVGSTYNFLPSIYNDLMKYFYDGDIDKARELQIISQNIISLMPKYNGSIVFGKAIMKLIGIDCGPNRLPLRNLSGNELSSLEKDLKDLNFFKMCAI
ncbi:MAG: dihydrodipicolinate synthase family protein [Bacteroidales bacterium]|nr:dihydrodipicolinate synthase family protein [Bacteroidales bacterium]